MKDRDKKVVVIDNDFVIRQVIKSFLARVFKNVELYSSENGVEGLGLVISTNPDLVIIDVTLPKYSGRELIDYLVSNPRFDDTTVIVLNDGAKKLVLPKEYIKLDKKDPYLLHKLIKSVGIRLGFLGLSDGLTDKLRLYIGSRTIKWADRAGKAIEKAEGARVPKKIYLYAKWIVEQIITSVYMTGVWLLLGKGDEANVEQKILDISSFRVRYYPTLTGIVGTLFIMFLQVALFMVGGITIFNMRIETTNALKGREVDIDLANSKYDSSKIEVINGEVKLKEQVVEEPPVEEPEVPEVPGEEGAPEEDLNDLDDGDDLDHPNDPGSQEDQLDQLDHIDQTEEEVLGAEDIREGGDLQQTSRYPTDKPVIEFKQEVKYTDLDKILELSSINTWETSIAREDIKTEDLSDRVLPPNAITYQLSPDGVNWYYYPSASSGQVGWEKTSAGWVSSNTVQEVNLFLDLFEEKVGVGKKMYIRAYLHSDGETQVTLKRLTVVRDLDIVTPVQPEVKESTGKLEDMSVAEPESLFFMEPVVLNAAYANGNKVIAGRVELKDAMVLEESDLANYKVKVHYTDSRDIKQSATQKGELIGEAALQKIEVYGDEQYVFEMRVVSAPGGYVTAEVEYTHVGTVGGEYIHPSTSNLSKPVENATLTVSEGGDQVDASAGDGFCDHDLGTPGSQCTLRAAIEEANMLAGNDNILFNIPNSDNSFRDFDDPATPGSGDGVGGDDYWSIAPGSSLPNITETADIDVSTQTVNQGDMNTEGPEIELVGYGLYFDTTAVNSTLNSIVINKTNSNPCVIVKADSFEITNSYINLNVIGTARPVPGANYGVNVDQADNVYIGTNSLDGNIISGNTSYGILAQCGSGLKTVNIYGNTLGLGKDQVTTIANTIKDIELTGDCDLVQADNVYKSGLTYTWNGNGNDSKCGGVGTSNYWSCPENWDRNLLPRSGDPVVFNASTTKNSWIDQDIEIKSLLMDATYLGTVAIGPGNTLATLNGGITQNGGTFVGGDGYINLYSPTHNLGNLVITGGTFSNSSNGIELTDDLTYSGGTFYSAGRTVKFYRGYTYTTSVITCTGDLPGIVVFDFLSGGVNKGEISAGCNVNLGDNPVSSLHGLTNDGTITIPSGTWHYIGLNTWDAGLTNNGIINHNGDEWLHESKLINNATGVINYSGQEFRVERDYNNQGTFNLTGKDLVLETLGWSWTFTDVNTLNVNNFTIMQCCNLFVNLNADVNVEGDFNGYGRYSSTAAYNINVKGDILWDSGPSNSGNQNWGSSLQTVTLNGTDTQTISFVEIPDSLSYTVNAPFVVNKSSGSVIFDSDFTSNSTCDLQSGISYDFKGYDFICSGGFDIGDNAQVRLAGSQETISTPTIGDNVSVIYYGEGGTSGTWTQTDWSGGAGQAKWNNETMYLSSNSNVIDIPAGQFTLPSDNLFNNSGLESSLHEWDEDFYTTTPSNPDVVSGLGLWLKADAISGLSDGDYVVTWNDSSGNGNDAVQTDTDGFQAIYKANVINGNPVVRFDGLKDYYSFNEIDDIRTVFWVFKEDPAASNSYRCALGHSATYDFLRGANRYWWNNASSVNVKYGYLRTNRQTINGLSTTIPTDFSINSLVTLGNAEADQLTTDRWVVESRGWHGDIAEVIIYNRELSTTERRQVETYLDNKYNILTPFAGSTITHDTGITYNGSNGSAKVVTTASEYDFGQAVSLPDTNDYYLEAYVYTDGSPVTSADAELTFGTTSYTSVGGGWYKLSTTFTASRIAGLYGVKVKPSKTVYIDNLSIYNSNISLQTGVLTSSIYNTEHNSKWGYLNYSANTPVGTGVQVKARTGNASDLSDAQAFASCTSIADGSSLSSNSCVNDDDRYIQYEVTLSTTDVSVTPVFEAININYATETFSIFNWAYKDMFIDGPGGIFNSQGDISTTGNIELQSGTFDLNGFNLTSGGSLKVNAGTTLQLQGGETSTTPTLAAGSTVRYDGESGVFTIKGWPYSHLNIAGSTSTFSLPGNISVGGNLVLEAGSLTSNGQSINLSGNWINSGGSYSCSSGAVNLVGGDQRIEGSNTFCNLSKTFNSTLYFDAGTTTTVNGLLRLRGASMANKLNLRSTAVGFQSYLEPKNGVDVKYLNVKDNNNIGPDEIVCLDCTDAGNNYRWIFQYTPQPVIQEEGQVVEEDIPEEEVIEEHEIIESFYPVDVTIDDPTPTFDWADYEAGEGEVTYDLYIDGILVIGGLIESGFELTEDFGLSEGIHEWYVIVYVTKDGVREEVARSEEAFFTIKFETEEIPMTGEEFVKKEEESLLSRLFKLSAPLQLAVLATVLTSSFFGSLGNLLLRMGLLFGFITPKRKYWGIVFDLFESKPIPFAVIRLLKGDKQVTHTVSDLDGKYGLIVEESGDYNLEVKADGYEPYYKDVNFIKGKEVMEDIPMKKIEGSVNEIKKLYCYLRPELVKLFKGFLLLLMFAGLVYSIYSTLQGAIWLNYVTIVLYGVIITINIYRTVKFRKVDSGKVISKEENTGVGGVSVRVYDKERQLEVALTNKEGFIKLNLKPGKYGFLASKAGYEMIKKKEESTKSIQVEKGGLLQKDIRVKRVDSMEGEDLGKKFGSPFSG
ncbi:response regulator [Candidatus Dojkabacteria bacterium]|nr:response regulator [Candidatus Dojkabacteria bacterium]